jgi:hypothetical protein
VSVPCLLHENTDHWQDLAARRNSGPVPWLDIFTRQSEFINQVDYMPLVKGGISWASSSAPGRSRASTVVPGESDDELMDGEFVLLREPSKMHKQEIHACFTRWMARQEEGKIPFEFANILNSQEGTLWLAVQLQELSDLDDTDPKSMIPPPCNLPKRKQTKNKTKGKRHTVTTQETKNESELAPKPRKKKQPAKTTLPADTPPNEQAAGIAPPIPDNLLSLEWDPSIDPMLCMELIPPGQYVTAVGSNIPVMMGSTSGPTAVNMTGSTYASYLAHMEHGGYLMDGPVPGWMQNGVINNSPAPTLWLVIRLAENYQLNMTLPSLPMDTIPEASLIGSTDSVIPDCTKHWMKTRSRSCARNTDEGMTTQDAGMSMPAEGSKKKCKRARSNEDNSRGQQMKRSKSSNPDIKAMPGPHPMPRPKGRGDASINPPDTFDLRHQHAG